MDGGHFVTIRMQTSRVGERLLGAVEMAGPLWLQARTGFQLEQLLGDLHGVGGRPLAEVVADAPEEQGVGAARGPGGSGRRRPRRGPAAAAGRGYCAMRRVVDDGHARGARPRASRAASGVIGRSVSTRIDSLWLYRTGHPHAGRADVDRRRPP